jgi:hypothetical protein
VFLVCCYLRVILCFFTVGERRFSFGRFCSFDVVELEGVVLFGVVLTFVDFLYFFKT